MGDAVVRGKRSRVKSSVFCVLALPFLLSPGVQTTPVLKTIVASKGKVAFQLKPSDDDSYFLTACKEHICYCDSDIEYVRIVSGVDVQVKTALNRQLKAYSDSAGCKYLDAIDSVTERVSYVSSRFLSIEEHSVSLAYKAGGSCHARSLVHTFDLRSGKEYLLGDVISSSSLSAVRAMLPEAIVREFERHHEGGSVAESPEDRKEHLESARKAVESLSDRDILNEPVFLKNQHVAVNVEGYYFSCAAGEFWPAEIPMDLITLPALHDELSAFEKR